MIYYRTAFDFDKFCCIILDLGNFTRIVIINQSLDLLNIDDFGVKVMDGQQLLDFMELLEDRHGRKATIIMSQLAVTDWYDVMLSNTTAADAILDRMVHTAYRFELEGDTMRKPKN